MLDVLACRAGGRDLGLTRLLLSGRAVPAKSLTAPKNTPTSKVWDDACEPNSIASVNDWTFKS